MQINYKKLYAEHLEFSLDQLKHNQKNPKWLSKHIDYIFNEKRIYDLIGNPQSDRFWKKIVINAEVQAIKKYKKEMNAKGLNIYGKPLKQSFTNDLNKIIKAKGFKK